VTPGRQARSSHETSLFTLVRDPVLLGRVGQPRFLTTARYEPTLRRQLGAGHIDLVFESAETIAVIGGVQLDPNWLVTRERFPIIWPASIAAVLPNEQLLALEEAIVPWLRAIARGRAMVTESIRAFVPSERFARARAAGLVGAVPFDRSIPAMAPFVYARRFAVGANVALDCAHAALAHALLADVAASVAYRAGAQVDDFALAWYGLERSSVPLEGVADVAIVDRRGAHDANVVIELAPAGDSAGSVIDVPSPVPWDVLFTFDVADAPAVSRFAVTAVEAACREAEPLAPAVPIGGSSGVIALAVGVEALHMRGDDIAEVEILRRLLTAEGFTLRIVSSTDDAGLADAQLLHIFGAPTEPHTLAFAEYARGRGLEFVFDCPPQASDPSAFAETIYPILHRLATAEAEVEEYLLAFLAGRVDRMAVPNEPNTDEYARRLVRFGELARSAAGILVMHEDRETMRALVQRAAAERVVPRAVFAGPEPAGAAIGHLVPNVPFAFAHGVIGARSNLMPVAFAAERRRVPLVIAGPVYDVEYLQVLRAAAPSAIVLADAAPAVVSSLFRQAAIYVDAAARPASAGGLFRAVACGALPVLAATSPLARMAGGAAPTFNAASAAHCGDRLAHALGSLDRTMPVAELRVRLLARRNPAAALRDVLAAYSRTATAV
jgi:hypothetical protein